MSDGITYDGDLSEPQQTGPIVPMVDQLNGATIWMQTLLQRVSLWLPAPHDSAGPLGGFLISESKPEIVDGDVVKWQREFAEVPRTHTETSFGAYSYQFITSDLFEISCGAPIYVEHEYFHTTDESSITIIRASKYTKVGDQILYLGTLPVGGSRLVSSDSSLERWRGSGNIWVRKTSYVKVRTLESFTPS